MSFSNRMNIDELVDLIVKEAGLTPGNKGAMAFNRKQLFELIAFITKAKSVANECIQKIEKEFRND